MGELVGGLIARAKSVAGCCYTSAVRNTHKSEWREVQYRGHPWHGQRVWIRGEARRSGQVVLRCVQDELKRFPLLEIPAWMFDSTICSRMTQNDLAYVSSSALLALKDLLATAAPSIASSMAEEQHLPSSSGDADAHIIMVKPTSGRVVLPSNEVAAVATGSAAPDSPSVGADVERTSEQTASFTSGGGR